MFGATHWPEMHFCDEEWNDTYEEKKAENKWPRSGNVENLFRLSDPKSEEREKWIFFATIPSSFWRGKILWKIKIILKWW